MLKNAFHFTLAAIFIVLVIIFAYKKTNKREIVKVPLNENSISQNVDNGNSRQKIESIVKDFIMDNPETIVSSLEKLQKQNLENSSQKAADYIKDNKEKIESDGKPPILGNVDGDLTIVMFYDYNCGFCKKANLVINNIIKSDSGIKIILRPLPILSDSSVHMAKAALALHKISEINFIDIHNEIMQEKQLDKEVIKKISEKYDVDYSVLENEINSYAIKQSINQNYDLAKSLNITGAPSYIINGIFVSGFIPEEKFKQIILKIRASS